MKKIRVFFDGGCREKLEIYTFGWVMKSNKVLASGGGSYKRASGGSFYAEAYALRQVLVSKDVSHVLRECDHSFDIELIGDNKVLIDMLNNGKSPDKECCGNTRQIFFDVANLFEILSRKHPISLVWVPREKNRVADHICRTMADISA